MKELKFSPENLKRHLNAAQSWNGRRIIYTTRDKLKGKCGEVFHIEGAGYFVLEAYFCYPDYVDEISLLTWWKKEGFNSFKEFITELRRIYPHTCDFYVHKLIEVFL